MKSNSKALKNRANYSKGILFLISISLHFHSSQFAWSNEVSKNNQNFQSELTTIQKSTQVTPSHSNSKSHLDYSGGFGVQSMPMGAAAYVDAGYSHLLWGKKEGQGFQYGYVRPAARVQTSALINRAEVYLDFFPISFFGVSSGASLTSRNTNLYSGVNCTSVECKGTLSRQWIKPKLILGYADFFFIGSLKLETLKHSSMSPFVDDMNILIAQSGGDRTTIVDLTVGYQWSGRIATGVHGSSVRMTRSKSSNRLIDLYAAYQSQHFRYLGGVGLYQSQFSPLSPTAYFLVQWMGRPSFALN